MVYAQPAVPHVRVGQLRRDPDIPAFLLADSFLGKHFAILGSTGSGKACAVTVILRSLPSAFPYAHIVLIDPHGEYGAAFGEQALHLDAGTLELPYWLLTQEEAASILTSRDAACAYAEAAILRDAILRAKFAYLGVDPDSQAITVDAPVPYRLSDAVRFIEEEMGALNKPEAVASYRHLIGRINIMRDDRRYAFMFQAVVLRDTMEAVLSRLIRIPVAGKPITILDISSVPSEIVNIVVSLLAAFSLSSACGASVRWACRCSWSARRRTATCRATRPRALARPGGPSIGLPRRAGSMASPCALSANARPSFRPAASRNAGPSWRCA